MIKKEITLVRGFRTESHQAFRTRILEACHKGLEEADPVAMKVTITHRPPPGLSVIPFRRDKIAAISVYQDDERTFPFLTMIEGYSGTYCADEALPVAYKKVWKDGERTPGVCLLTLFRKKPDIEYSTFLHRWHNGHTPLSLKIHPLWNYSRNVITGSDGDPYNWYDGIVEEQLRKRSHLTNPFSFFGNPLVIIQHMMAVYKDVNGFLDYKGIETYYTGEWIIRSKPDTNME